MKKNKTVEQRPRLIENGSLSHHTKTFTLFFHKKLWSSIFPLWLSRNLKFQFQMSKYDIFELFEKNNANILAGIEKW